MGFARWERGEHGRQLNTKHGAACLRVVAQDFASVFLDDTETDAQTETRALPNRFRRVERIENAMRLLDTWTGVGKKNDHAAAIARRLDGKNAALMRFHGIDSVVDEIEKHLHELITVAANTREDRLELQFNARLWRAIERAKLNCVGDDGVDVEERAFRWHLACKTEQVADERLCAASLVSNFSGGRTSLFGKRRIIGEQIGKSENRRERIVDFVRRPCGELAERYKLFGLYELRLETLEIFDRL